MLLKFVRTHLTRRDHVALETTTNAWPANVGIHERHSCVVGLQEFPAIVVGKRVSSISKVATWQQKVAEAVWRFSGHDKSLASPRGGD
jgi:hypothetical protein